MKKPAYYFQRLSYYWNNLKNDTLCFLGFRNFLLENRTAARILVYHGIDLSGNLSFNTRFISRDYFEKQIAFFKKNFNFVSLEDFYKGNFPPERLTLALTFDDGYANNYKYVLPLLGKYQVPATFFITGIQDAAYDILWSDLLDLASAEISKDIVIEQEIFKNKKNSMRRAYYSALTQKTLKNTLREKDWNYKKKLYKILDSQIKFKENPQLSDYWQLMSKDEIRKLASSPWVSIGSHGYYHNNLGLIPFEEACKELEQSKSYLENIIQKEVNKIAYPDGSYSSEILDYAEKIGYQYQLAVDFLFEADKEDTRLRERLGINPFISWSNQLIAIAKGTYY